jgi:TolB-like protein/tetratricopeptide (TPR) repeat protein
MLEGGGEDKASVRAPAVFISYASQDAAAAARICSALRQAGVEVWFDQSELRGGDVWDQRIRREIRDCTLFMPVISANTASRHEGYFRLEWDLADQRTHMMARDRAFIVPVCLDATQEAGTDVPESFHRVQWTRLPDGNTPPAFSARIVALLSAPGAVAFAADSALSGETTGPVVPPAATAKLTPRSRLAVIALVSVVAVVLAYVVVDRFWLSKHTLVERPVAAVTPALPPATPAIPEKSVAVLPFVDMSEKKDQEYFADGTAEEILNLLAKVPGLRVPARTSSFYFKGKSEDIPTIARRLMVAHVLEGSVRKSGNHVRITVQLVRADNGYHIWSETYDRTLEDIFKVQDEIAAEVVRGLKISLSANELPRGVAPQNTEAHLLVLQARFLMNRGAPDDWSRAVRYYQQAVQLDPASAPAWAGLSSALTLVGMSSGGLQTGRLLQEARAPALQAAERAIALDAKLTEGHEALAYVRYLFDWDWTAAEAECEKVRTLDPASTCGLLKGNLAAMRGNLVDALTLWEQAAVNDPLNIFVLGSLAFGYYSVGQFSEAEANARKVTELSPTAPASHTNLAQMLLAQGKQGAALAEIEKESDAGFRVSSLARAYAVLGRRAESLTAIALVEKSFASNQPYNIAAVYALLGERDQAFSWLERAYQRHDSALVGIPPFTVDPDLKSLRGDPRYKALLRKMNLPS